MEQESNRDLRWMVGSAPLFRGADATVEAPIVPIIWPDRRWFCAQLRELDRQLALEPEPVPTRFQDRLGGYAEQLVAQWLHKAPGLELIAANIPIRDASRRTLGEIDMLVQTASGLEHWEIALKFYLRRDGANRGLLEVAGQRWPYWFGVDPRDRLDLKYRRLCEHQLRLLRFQQTRDWLAARGLQVRAARAIVKGRLFTRLSQTSGEVPLEAVLRGEPTRPALPMVLAPDHETGWWMSVDEFAASCATSSGDLRFVELHGRAWLAPISTPQEGVEAAAIVARVNGEVRPFALHVAHIAAPEHADRGVEVSRGFIVNNVWLRQTESIVTGLEPTR